MPQSMLNRFDSVRTTVTLPRDLSQRSQQLVDMGKIPSRNALIVAALEHYIAELEREEIDRQFAAMAEDVDYQSLTQKIADSFADSDWEAWNIAEASQS